MIVGLADSRVARRFDDVRRFVDDHRGVASAHAVRRLAGAVRGLDHRWSASRDRQVANAHQLARQRNARTLDALQKIFRSAGGPKRGAHDAHNFVGRLLAGRMRREDDGVFALDGVDGDADRGDVRARDRNERGDHARRLGILDDLLFRNLFDDADALLTERIPEDAEHLRAAFRLGAAHPALGDAHLREPGRGCLVASGPRDCAAEAIDRCLVEIFDRAHCCTRSRQQILRSLLFGLCERARFRNCHGHTGSPSRVGGTPSYSTEILMRMGFSRVCSSITSALRPATRPMMKNNLPTIGGKPRSTRIAASAPSMLRGSGLIRSRIASSSDVRVHAVAESGQPLPGALCLVDGEPRGRFKRKAAALRAIEPRDDQFHATGSSSAVFVADREHAGPNSGGERLAVARRGQSSGCARGRARPVVGNTNQDRIDKATLSGRRQPIVVEQEDQIGERCLAHEGRDIVSADSQVRWAGVDDRCTPHLHSSGWILRLCRVETWLLR